MKKLFLMLAVAASAMTASAQEPKSGFADAKFWDNWYLGANLGAVSKAKHQAVLKNLNPQFGIRFGKWFTPSVGLAGEGRFLFGNKLYGRQLTDPSLFHAMEGNLLGTINFSNAFGGYQGSPRPFEVIGLAGIGFLHNFGTTSKGQFPSNYQKNMLTSKFGLDLAWNFGSEKEWQFYVEPALIYAIGGAKKFDKIQYNSNRAAVELNVGINYYFKTSNGTHHFLNITECDQREIDALNNTINDLRNKNAADQAKMLSFRQRLRVSRKLSRTARTSQLQNLHSRLQQSHLYSTMLTSLSSQSSRLRTLQLQHRFLRTTQSSSSTSRVMLHQRVEQRRIRNSLFVVLTQLRTSSFRSMVLTRAVSLLRVAVQLRTSMRHTRTTA